MLITILDFHFDVKQCSKSKVITGQTNQDMTRGCQVALQYWEQVSRGARYRVISHKRGVFHTIMPDFL